MDLGNYKIEPNSLGSLFDEEKIPVPDFLFSSAISQKLSTNTISNFDFLTEYPIDLDSTVESLTELPMQYRSIFDDVNYSTLAHNYEEISDIDIKSNIIHFINAIIISNSSQKIDIFTFLYTILANETNDFLIENIFTCIDNLICPGIINTLNQDFYDVLIKYPAFYFKIAEKISKSLYKSMNMNSKSLFLQFLLYISRSLNEETAPYLYSAHLNTYKVFPSLFPLVSLDFYSKSKSFDIQSQTLVIQIAHTSKKSYVLYSSNCIKAIIMKLIQMQDSAILKKVMKSLCAYLQYQMELHPRFMEDDLEFSQVRKQFSNMICIYFTECPFRMKKQNGSLITILLNRFPSMLFENIQSLQQGENVVDLRKVIVDMLDLEDPYIIQQLLYGLQINFNYCKDNELKEEMISFIQEEGIFEKINEIRTNGQKPLNQAADIVLKQIFPEL